MAVSYRTGPFARTPERGHGLWLGLLRGRDVSSDPGPELARKGAAMTIDAAASERVPPP